MTFNELIVEIKRAKKSCYVFEKSKRSEFRDRLNVYYDGKILFERFCYGEAAGLVFCMWAQGVDSENNINWDYETCKNSKKTQAPKKIANYTSNYLQLDDKELKWECVKKLSFDRKNGYGFLKMVFTK